MSEAYTRAENAAGVLREEFSQGDMEKKARIRG